MEQERITIGLNEKEVLEHSIHDTGKLKLKDHNQLARYN